MAADRFGESVGGAIGPIEHRLTMHLERAHELAERAQRSNDAVQHEIDRALEIFDRLRGHMTDPGER
jgi:hypothetical protein